MEEMRKKKGRRLTSVLFVKCEPGLYARVARAAEVTGHNNISSFIRATVIEKMLQLSVVYPELKEKHREAEAA